MSHKQEQIIRELMRLKVQRFRQKRRKSKNENKLDLIRSTSNHQKQAPPLFKKFDACVAEPTGCMNFNRTKPNEIKEKYFSTPITASSQEKWSREESKIADFKTLMLKCQTEHFTQIKKLELQLKTQSEEIAEMKLMMMELKNSGDHTSTSSNEMAHNNRLLDQEHSVLEKIKNLERFVAFDLKLKADRCFRDKIKKVMWPLVDVNKVSKSITTILMKFMSRELVLQFTAVKQTGDKRIFKDTAFCSCIHDAINWEFQIHQKMPAIKEHIFYRALGQVLGNAKDWHGHRKDRVKNMK